MDMFLSHSYKDREDVTLFWRTLTHLGFDIFYTYLHLSLGSTDQSSQILEAIYESEYFLIFVTPNYIDSKHCRNEYITAKTFNKIIIPIFISVSPSDCEIKEQGCVKEKGENISDLINKLVLLLYRASL